MEEIKELVAEIEGHEAGIKALTGHVSEDLVTKVVETTDKFDKDNNPIKVTKYVPTSIVTYNADENCYYIADEDNTVVTEEITETPTSQLLEVEEL